MADASRGLKKRKVSDDKRVHRSNGSKLRGGCVPWRPAAGQPETGDIEVLLIESLNVPGVWNFPGGSLDPGEDVAICAERETAEESGAHGVLGCFLGMFDKAGKASGGSSSWYWMLRVTSVENEGADTWRDPDSTWECNGVRSRKWFPLSALPKVKAPGDDLLVAMAGIPPEQRGNVLYRPAKPVAMPVVLLVADHSGTTGSIADQLHACASKFGTVRTLESAERLGMSAEQYYAYAIAYVRCADRMIVDDTDTSGKDAVPPMQCGWLLGVAAALGLPSLVITLSEEEEAETSRLRLMLAGSLGPVKIVGYSDEGEDGADGDELATATAGFLRTEHKRWQSH